MTQAQTRQSLHLDTRAWIERVEALGPTEAADQRLCVAPRC